jgi:hypothetical protein
VLGLHHEPFRGELQRIAVSLAETGAFANPYSVPTGPTAHCAPPYTLLVGAVFYLFGTGRGGEFALYFLNSAISAVQFALIPLFARSAALGRGVGLAAGLFGALVPYHYLNEIRAGEAPVFGLLLIALTLLTLRHWRDETWSSKRWILHGAWWGFAVLLNPVFLPVFSAFVWLTYRRYRPRMSPLSLVLPFLAAALVLTPWAIRNYWRLGGFTLVRSNFGIELGLSFNESARSDMQSNFDGGVFGQFHPILSTQAAEEVQKHGELAYNRRMLRDALEWIRENQGQAGRLIALRTVYFWFPKTPSLLRSLSLSALVLAAAAGLLVLFRRNSRAATLILVAWIFYPPVYYLLQSIPRYRYPLNWTFLVLSALAAVTLWERLRARLARSTR